MRWGEAGGSLSPSLDFAITSTKRSSEEIVAELETVGAWQIQRTLDILSFSPFPGSPSSAWGIYGCMWVSEAPHSLL